MIKVKTKRISKKDFITQCIKREIRIVKTDVQNILPSQQMIILTAFDKKKNEIIRHDALIAADDCFYFQKLTAIFHLNGIMTSNGLWLENEISTILNEKI
jgi:hypothetical protein